MALSNSAATPFHYTKRPKATKSCLQFKHDRVVAIEHGQTMPHVVLPQATFSGSACPFRGVVREAAPETCAKGREGRGRGRAGGWGRGGIWHRALVVGFVSLWRRQLASRP